MDRILQAAQFFAENRRTGRVADNLPPELRPAELSAAYAIQHALVEDLLQEHGGQTAGYKIACTNDAAKQLLNIDAPVFGRLLSSFVFRSPAMLKSDDFHVRCIESEYAFEIGADVPPAETPYTRETIADFVSAVIPSIEVVNHHFTDWSKVGGIVLAADNAIHGAWICGEPNQQWHQLDLENDHVRLAVNGNTVTTGSGANVLGHPLNVLAWLANDLPERGLQLKQGDFVTTGITTDVYLAQAGDKLEAEFAGLGSVELSFE